MIFTQLKTLLIILFTFFNFLNINAQNIAYNFSTANKEYFEHIYKVKMTNPAEDIYDLYWNHNQVHSYSALDAPDSYKIDLRQFSMPLKNNMTVTSPVGYRKRFKRNHNGVDISLHIGDTIYACFDGKVRMTAYQPSGYGNVVVLRHYNGLETIYGHMSKILVKENQYVKNGQPIGLGGNTGRSTGPHLHLETRFCGLLIDPQKIFDFAAKDVKSDFYHYKK